MLNPDVEKISSPFLSPVSLPEDYGTYRHAEIARASNSSVLPEKPLGRFYFPDRYKYLSIVRFLGEKDRHWLVCERARFATMHVDMNEQEYIHSN